MKKAILVPAVMFCSAIPLLAQAARVEFEAASIKPAEAAAIPGGGRGYRVGFAGGPGTSDPSRIDYKGASLKMLLMRAYGLPAYQVIGPEWLGSERFDLVATLPPATTKEQLAIMLQKLLQDRFGLQTHRESREMSLFVLIPAKSGPKLKASVADPAKPDRTPGVWIGPAGHMGSYQASAAMLCGALSAQLNRPVQDQTGLTGVYDFEFDYDAEEVRQIGADLLGLAGTPEAPGAASIFTAVQEKLGLKLEPRKGPVDVLVVDRILKTPVEN